ncbi:MAG: hypothetical protein WAS27_00255 [Candidatus Saccharimonadales bacterium]
MKQRIKEIISTTLTGDLLPEGIRDNPFAVKAHSNTQRIAAHAEMLREGAVAPDHMLATRALKKATRKRRSSIDFDTQHADMLHNYDEWVRHCYGRYVNEYVAVANTYDYPSLATLAQFYESQLANELQATNHEYLADADTQQYSPYAHAAVDYRLKELAGQAYHAPPHLFADDIPSQDELLTATGVDYSRLLERGQIIAGHTEALTAAVTAVKQGDTSGSIPRPV